MCELCFTNLRKQGELPNFLPRAQSSTTLAVNQTTVRQLKVGFGGDLEGYRDYGPPGIFTLFAEDLTFVFVGIGRIKR